MFDRFTDNAIRVIVRAQEESRRLGHNYVGTEQLLLGLIGVPASLAGRALKFHGINLRSARNEVEKIIGRGSGFVAVEIPFTPRAKQSLNQGGFEADKLNEIHVDTEHILLGLLRENSESQCVAVRVLQALGVSPSKLSETVNRLMDDRELIPKSPINPTKESAGTSDDTPSYYQMLQVDPQAEFGVILAAYNYLIKKYHPESETGDSFQFRLINYAWMILCDEDNRAAYDVRRSNNV